MCCFACKGSLSRTCPDLVVVLAFLIRQLKDVLGLNLVIPTVSHFCDVDYHECECHRLGA